MSGEDLVGVIFGGLVILPLLLTTALLITYGVWLIIGPPILWFIRYRAKTVEQKVQHWQQLGADDDRTLVRQNCTSGATARLARPKATAH